MEEKVDCQDEATPEASVEKPVLSKNQLKKQQRLQRWAETKKERRYIDMFFMCLKKKKKCLCKQTIIKDT